MKRIIAGNTYDTETAKEVAEWNSGQTPYNITYETETLYMTPEGSFFVTFAGFKYRNAGEYVLTALSKTDALEWWERRGRVQLAKHAKPNVETVLKEHNLA